ncbi:MAG: type II toxin-antitoxin system Phd/YefM family antitoxin [Caldilinea sp.]|nr:type II toxin-antitoxin system Phd/YefM family antitoxin [Caldilinea sp.]MCB9117216.1 type II toxin-antitoxin system Phd/YefM family antitoxin [Caldilineaceae bacterium]MCB9124581.1 type II toxin-antitoxin system Phd/YefM family antitoxin [Caldilineaceae bacterium]MCO5212526.1 type II toxin-antitoxin system Phd/YefM family antitoxin [Caldilinea sp.]
MLSWQVQEAKNKFSEVIERASHGDPQVITKHGTEVAVVISIDQFKSLKARSQSLVEFLLESPLSGSEIEVTRDKSLPREVPEL